MLSLITLFAGFARIYFGKFLNLEMNPLVLLVFFFFLIELNLVLLHQCLYGGGWGLASTGGSAVVKALD